MSGKDGVLVVNCTAPPEEVDALAGTLVEEHLAARVNIASVRSCYIWEGKLNLDPEAFLIIKTSRECFEMLRKRIAELRSYAVPEIIALPIAKSHPNCHGTFVMGIDSEKEIGRLRENEKKEDQGILEEGQHEGARQHLSRHPLASMRYIIISIQCRYTAKDSGISLQRLACPGSLIQA